MKEWWALHGKSVLTFAIATAAFVAVTAATGGLGAPVMLAMLAGGAASGAAGYVAGQMLDQKPIDAGDLAIATVTTAAITVATAGVGELVSPSLGRAAAPAVQVLRRLPGDDTAAAAIDAVPAFARQSLAGAASGGALNAATRAGENVVERRPIGDGVGEAAAEGAATGVIANASARALAARVTAKQDMIGGADRPPTAGFKSVFERAFGVEDAAVDARPASAGEADRPSEIEDTAEADEPETRTEPAPAVDDGDAGLPLAKLVAGVEARRAWVEGQGRWSRESLAGRAIMGEFQRARVERQLARMVGTPGKLERIQSALDRAESDGERAVILKAVASGNQPGNIEWLADQIRGKPLPWLLEKTTLSDQFDGAHGLKQQWSHSCQATSLQALRAEYDPVYALKAHLSNKDPHWVDEADAVRGNGRIARAQRRVLESKYGGDLTQWSGRKGRATSRQGSWGGQGRFVDDWMNAETKATGLRYRTEISSDVDRQIGILQDNLTHGRVTGAIVGSGPGVTAHQVLATEARQAGGEWQFRFYDPWEGTNTWVSEREIRTGSMHGVAGWRVLTGLEVPEPAE